MHGPTCITNLDVQSVAFLRDLDRVSGVADQHAQLGADQQITAVPGESGQPGHVGFVSHQHGLEAEFSDAGDQAASSSGETGLSHLALELAGELVRSVAIVANRGHDEYRYRVAARGVGG